MPPQPPEQRTTIHDQSKLQPFSFAPKKRVIIVTIIGILIIALAGFIMLGLLAKNSTPDQKLYRFKTSVFEPSMALTKLSDQSKLNYSKMLLETRVAELLVLSTDQSTSSPQTLDRLAQLTEQHTRDSITTISDSHSLSTEEKITALGLLTNTTRAFETLGDTTEEFANIKDYGSDIQDFSQESLSAEIQKFASTSDATALSVYTGEQITLIGEEIKTVAPNSRAQRLALVRIDDASESITDGRFSEAIAQLLRGRQAIAVDRYLYANERGEGPQETYDPGEVPEGS